MERRKLLRRFKRALVGSMTRRQAIRWWLKRPFQAPCVKLFTRHVSGPKNPKIAANEVAVVSVIRNGAFFLPTFLSHHLALGVSHFVFLDNGSTDETLRILTAQGSRVTVLSCRLPFRYFQTGMRILLSNLFPGRWKLHLDVDEHFEYPGSDRCSLRELVSYLDENHYTALPTFMLDVFPDADLKVPFDCAAENMAKVHCYYDLTDISRSPMPSLNTYANPAIQHTSGGIRLRTFGINSNLTKHALTKNDGILRWLDCHFVLKGRCADFSGLLLHYKFAGDFRSLVDYAVKAKNYSLNSQAYQEYQKKLQAAAPLQLKGETSKKFDGCDSLLAQGFLVQSKKFSNWLELREQDGALKSATPNIRKA